MIYIHKKDDEHGVFVAKCYDKGSVLREFEHDSFSTTPTRTSIQVAPAQHVEDVVGIYVNHACFPTCKITNMKIVAIKDLNEGDELTFDYNENEDELASPFQCKCCGKMIRGKYGG